MKLKIDNIQLRDLVDTGTAEEPQDPALRIVVAGQELFTKRHVKEEVKSIFTDIFEIEIDEYEYKDGKLEIEVEVINFGFDNGDGTTKAIHVGRGRVTLATAIPTFDNEAYFIIDLTHNSRRGVLRQGEVLMRGFIHDPEALREALKFKTIELENLKKSYEEYITSSKQLEAEMELALEKAEAKMQRLTKKQVTTTTQLTEITERYTQLSEQYSVIQTELMIAHENQQYDNHNASQQSQQLNELLQKISVLTQQNAQYNSQNLLQTQQINEALHNISTLTQQNESLQHHLRIQEQDRSTMQNEIEELYTSKTFYENQKSDEINKLKAELAHAQQSKNNTNNTHTALIIEMTNKMQLMSQEITDLRSANTAHTSIVYNNTYINNSSYSSTVINSSHFESIVISNTVNNVYIKNLLQTTDIDMLRTELINQIKQNETLSKMNAKHLNYIQNNKNNMLIAVRVRPASDDEISQGGKLCIDTSSDTLLCYDKSVLRWKPFDFDLVYGYDASQSDIYCDIEPMIANVCGINNHYSNSCIITYGQYNSGKKYTMNGIPQKHEYIGLRYRALMSIFDMLNNKQISTEKTVRQQAVANANQLNIQNNVQNSPVLLDETQLFYYEVGISFVEVMGDKLTDLLTSNKSSTQQQYTNLTSIQYDSNTHSVNIPGLTTYKVQRASDGCMVISNAITQRLATLLQQQGGNTADSNHISTHNILIITVITRFGKSTTSANIQRLHMVDLSAADNTVNDNNLLALQNVFTALQQQQLATASQKIGTSLSLQTPNIVIPYESSKLTQILRGSIGTQNNNKTMLILTIQPTDLSLQQTLHNLTFVASLKDTIPSGKKVSGSPTGGNSLELRNAKTELNDLKQRQSTYEKTLTETKNTAARLIESWKTQYYESQNNINTLTNSNTQMKLDLSLTHRNLKRVLEQFTEQTAINERLLKIIKIFESEVQASSLEKLCVCSEPLIYGEVIVDSDRPIVTPVANTSSPPHYNTHSTGPSTPYTPSHGISMSEAKDGSYYLYQQQQEMEQSPQQPQLPRVNSNHGQQQVMHQQQQSASFRQESMSSSRTQQQQQFTSTTSSATMFTQQNSQEYTTQQSPQQPPQLNQTTSPPPPYYATQTLPQYSQLYQHQQQSPPPSYRQQQGYGGVRSPLSDGGAEFPM